MPRQTGVFEIENRGDLPPGRVFLCDDCGTRLKEGQPHSSVKPRPHQSLTTLVVRENLADAAPAPRLLTAPWLDAPLYVPPVPGGGRIITGPLVQNENGFWEEESL